MGSGGELGSPQDRILVRNVSQTCDRCGSDRVRVRIVIEYDVGQGADRSPITRDTERGDDRALGFLTARRFEQVDQDRT